MVLRFHRDLPRLEAQHATRSGSDSIRSPEDDHAVGVMGYGSIGAPIVEVLGGSGYPVAVWTRTPRRVEGVESFAGPTEFAPFLGRSRRARLCAAADAGNGGLLAAGAFAALPRGAYVINVSRGAVLREDDLAAAVDVGHLAGAALDVFATEPLPAASPLWRHPKILCTPHIAARAARRRRGAAVPRQPAPRARGGAARQHRGPGPRILAPRPEVP